MTRTRVWNVDCFLRHGVITVESNGHAVSLWYCSLTGFPISRRETTATVPCACLKQTPVYISDVARFLQARLTAGA